MCNLGVAGPGRRLCGMASVDNHGMQRPKPHSSPLNYLCSRRLLHQSSLSHHLLSFLFTWGPVGLHLLLHSQRFVDLDLKALQVAWSLHHTYNTNNFSVANSYGSTETLKPIHSFRRLLFGVTLNKRKSTSHFFSYWGWGSYVAAAHPNKSVHTSNLFRSTNLPHNSTLFRATTCIHTSNICRLPLIHALN